MGCVSRAGKFFHLKRWKRGWLFANQYGAKVYVAANMVTHEGNEEGAGAFFKKLRDIGISAVIISDPALIEILCIRSPWVRDFIYQHRRPATNAETLKILAK